MFRFCRALENIAHCSVSQTENEQTEARAFLTRQFEASKDQQAVKDLEAALPELQKQSSSGALDDQMADAELTRVPELFETHASALWCSSSNLMLWQDHDHKNKHGHGRSSDNSVQARDDDSSLQQFGNDINGYPKAVVSEMRDLFSDIIDFTLIAKSLANDTALTSHVLAPRLVIWACFIGDSALANLFWQLCRESIEAGFLCSAFCRSMISRSMMSHDYDPLVKPIVSVWWSIAE